MSEDTDIGDLLFATILSLFSIYLLHLFLPFLLSISGGLYLAYGYLQESESYGHTFSLLTAIVLAVGYFDTYFQEFSLAQTETTLVVGFLLASVKLVLQIPGVSMGSKVVQLQLSGVGSAVASKGILATLFSFISLQSVALIAGIGLAIIPVLFLELVSWILGIRTHPMLIFGGLVSLGMVAIVLDIKDKLKVMASKLTDSGAADATASEYYPREIAEEMCEDINEDLPPLEEVSWSRTEINNLSPEEFYSLCSQATESECNDENITFHQIKDASPFGYGYHLVEDGLEILEVGLIIDNEEDPLDYDQIHQNIITLLDENQLDATFVILSSNIDISTEEQIDVLSGYGIYVGGIDFTRQRFEDQNITE